MILDSLSNLKNYTSCHLQFADVVSFIQNTNLQDLPNGKHPINEKGAFASVNEYETKLEADCFIECHKAYIDIQMITKGQEYIGYCPTSDCVAHAYDAEKDLQKLDGSVSYFTIKPEMFAVFFPHDAHMPCIRKEDKASLVKKIVFKIPV